MFYLSSTITSLLKHLSFSRQFERWEEKRFLRMTAKFQYFKSICLHSFLSSVLRYVISLERYSSINVAIILHKCFCIEVISSKCDMNVELWWTYPNVVSFDINSATECILVSFYDVYVFPHSIPWWKINLKKNISLYGVWCNIRWIQ